ncbi:MAG: hypothetical protein K2Q26_12640 [Bdellovibrionales bacterium]|nr:hypothetical protein [Bdellovibrionales bacterium]
MRGNSVSNYEYVGDDFYSEEFDDIVSVAYGPSTLDEIRQAVRSWYGNLPVDILVINKKLQNAIMEFECLCDRGILDLDVLSQSGSSAV